MPTSWRNRKSSFWTILFLIVPFLLSGCQSAADAADLEAAIPDADHPEPVMLSLVNDARAQARFCGAEHSPAAPPLVWDQRLAVAAELHSQDMADRDYMAHEDPEGRTPGDRISAQGYEWQTFAENVAAGYRTYEEALAGLLASPGHCKNLMNPRVRDFGAGYGTAPSSKWTHYWTQKFGVHK